MSLFAFHENAPTAAALDGTEILPINQSGVIKQITASALRAMPDTVTSATVSSTGTPITATGVTNITSTNIVNFTMALPTVAGQRKVMVNTATTTATTVAVSTGDVTLDGGTAKTITFLAKNASIDLVALSTTRWAFIGSTIGFTVT